MTCGKVEVDNKYEIEEDARTLIRAEEIKMDSKRRKSALAHLKKQKDQISAVETSHSKGK